MDKNLKELIEYSREGVLSKEVFKNENFDVRLFCTTLGTEIGEHTSTKQGFVRVLEGNGVFILEGKGD